MGSNSFDIFVHRNPRKKAIRELVPIASSKNHRERYELTQCLVKHMKWAEIKKLGYKMTFETYKDHKRRIGRVCIKKIEDPDFPIRKAGRKPLGEGDESKVEEFLNRPENSQVAANRTVLVNNERQTVRYMECSFFLEFPTNTERHGTSVYF